MINVSEVKTYPPTEFRTPLHKKVYDTLETLGIEYERVDNDPAITMEDCAAINERLGCEVIKTLFLCNRQKTSFYLFVTLGDKPFVTKDFSRTLGVSRVSFAPSEMLFDMLGVEVGATTVFGLLLDEENEVRLVLDSEILRSEDYGCTDSTNTGYMKISTGDLLEKFLPYAKHEPVIIDI
jgi:Ala-tRNA(Pro) deacylase